MTIREGNRRIFLKTVGLGAAAIATQALRAGERRPRGRPSVLVVLTDDQGWGDVHSHGNEKLDTPVMDRLASHHDDIRVLHLNLLDVSMAYLAQRGLLDKALEIGDQDAAKTDVPASRSSEF